MAKGSNEEAIGIVRIDVDLGGHLRIAQAEMGPGLAGVCGFVNAVAGGQVGADDARAGAYIDDVGVGGRDRDCADGAGGLIVKQRLPGGTIIGGTPDAAVIKADVKNIGLAGNARECSGTSGARRTDLAPFHF